MPYDITVYYILSINSFQLLNHLNRNVRQRTFWHVRSTKTQISLRISVVWSESSPSTWRNFASLAIQNAPSEDSDQTARMRSLIWIFAGRTSPKVRFLTFRFISCVTIAENQFHW